MGVAQSTAIRTAPIKTHELWTVNERGSGASRPPGFRFLDPGQYVMTNTPVKAMRRPNVSPGVESYAVEFPYSVQSVETVVEYLRWITSTWSLRGLEPLQ